VGHCAWPEVGQSPGQLLFVACVKFSKAKAWENVVTTAAAQSSPYSSKVMTWLGGRQRAESANRQATTEMHSDVSVAKLHTSCDVFHFSLCRGGETT
jgi:hypothetical protein